MLLDLPAAAKTCFVASQTIKICREWSMCQVAEASMRLA